MKVVIQRSKESSVKVEDKIVGKIAYGMVLLICFEKGDNETAVTKAIHKITNVRMFEDPQTKKMSLNLQQVNGEILCISQFTLSWEGEKGHRPSFDNSLPPDDARSLYNKFCEGLISAGFVVASGVFGAYMEVNITNDGPVTFILKF
ncbi:MAG: D-tyrosyl-tRNA(Tyr) deacylase [Oligoflexia bacterium]|nr:D-tyrosyl-tRNA(Tyr) deacylase [Oligoflexia bacterium]